MTFDRKEYQRQYMKDYMQKRRATPEQCLNCGFYPSYCDGLLKVKSCPHEQTVITAKTTAYEKRVLTLLEKPNKYGQLKHTKLMPIFIREWTFELLAELLKDDSWESMDNVLRGLLNREKNWGFYNKIFDEYKAENEKLKAEIEKLRKEH